MNGFKAVLKKAQEIEAARYVPVPTQTSVVLPIVGAVRITEVKLGGNAHWAAVNPKQEEFLRSYYEPSVPLLASVPELESSAEVLRSEDFYEVRAKSVLDITVEWPELGEPTNIEHAITKWRFAGVRMNNEFVVFLRVAEHPYPIAQVMTKSGDSVHMTMCPGARGLKDRDLDRLVATCFTGKQMRPTFREFGGLRFPMVKHERLDDIDWLVGMCGQDAEANPAEIVEATQETKLRMNCKGARVRSEVQLRTMVILSAGPMDVPPPDHTIDLPFLIWFTRPSLPVPYAIALIGEADWRDPGNLENI